MKKFLILTFLMLCSISLFAQKLISVDINNPIYDIIEMCQMKGLCSPVSGAKPFTESKIRDVLNEILDNSDKLNPVELQVINEYIENSKNDEKGQLGSLSFDSKLADTDVDFKFYYGQETTASAGVYNKSDYNAFGFDFLIPFGFSGDIGDYFGFGITGIFDVSKVPLHLDGDYYVGYKWATVTDAEKTEANLRKIKSYSNNAFLPYSYVKPWAGQFYYLSNMSAEGLEGWSHELGISANILPEIRTAFLDNKINIALGRVYREWAAMDKRSSLVLNGTAMPFFGLDISVDILPFLSYSSLTGTLEYPNRDDVLEGSLPGESQDDTQYWQNAFSVNMVELNWNGIHADFGSSVIWPKRFELGYLFPLTNYVEYQNHIGDCDNLGLFADLKYTYSGIGSIWGSFYLDEINGLNNNPFTKTRAMFAYQAGVKACIPSVPFGQLAFRYTKIEPYCYTHQMINNSPYYCDYIAQNYMNNGICLGSYLPPNSDEFLIRFDAQPIATLQTSVGYQLIRHGADYGSQQVRGSSLYSELDPKRTNQQSKYFLHDGAYNWIHILSVNASYSSRKTFVPFQVSATLGGVISYYTGISIPTAPAATNQDNAPGADFSTPYSLINTDEYPFRVGPVFTVNFAIGHF